MSPKVTYMSPERFATIGERLFGLGWQTTFAQRTGYSRAHVVKYVQGGSPIPQHVALLVYLMAQRLDAGRPVRVVPPAGTLAEGVFTPAPGNPELTIDGNP